MHTVSDHKLDDGFWLWAWEQGYIYHSILTCLFTGVGGIEAEAVMLGQAISMVLPKVLGYKLTGDISPLATSTDVVLTITKVTAASHMTTTTVQKH